MLRFLVDNSAGEKLANALKNQNYNTIYAGEELPDAEDEEILERAEKENQK